MSDELAERHLFKPRELTETLIKYRGIHEGIWMLYVEFKLLGSNTGPSPDEMYPTAIVPITVFGIQRVKEENPLTVDAAKVNPLVMTA